jgi:hypothetical protein
LFFQFPATIGAKLSGIKSSYRKTCARWGIKKPHRGGIVVTTQTLKVLAPEGWHFFTWIINKNIAPDEALHKPLVLIPKYRLA